jgi:hypothetical protein
VQGRLIDNRSYFACDATGCAEQLHTATVVLGGPNGAVKVAHNAGWHTETIKPGARWHHRCPAHA